MQNFHLIDFLFIFSSDLWYWINYINNHTCLSSGHDAFWVCLFCKEYMQCCYEQINVCPMASLSPFGAVFVSGSQNTFKCRQLTRCIKSHLCYMIYTGMTCFWINSLYCSCTGPFHKGRVTVVTFILQNQSMTLLSPQSGGFHQTKIIFEYYHLWMMQNM